MNWGRALNAVIWLGCGLGGLLALIFPNAPFRANIVGVQIGVGLVLLFWRA